MHLRRALLECTVGPARLHAALWRGKRLMWEAELPPVPLHELGAVLRALGESSPGGLPGRLRYRLEPPLVQHRSLADLPAVSRRELARLVAHNAGRYFRQNGHRLLTAGAWDGAPGGMARLIAAEVNVLGALVDAARAADCLVEDIVATTPAPPTLSLLPPGEVARRRAVWLGRLARASRGLGALLGLLGAAYVGRLTWEDRRLARELARLEAPRAALARVRREASAAEAMLAALIQAEAERGDLAGRLAVLTLALPSEGLVERITLTREGRGEIEGRAADVAAMLARLTRVGPAALPRPVTREPGPTGMLEQYLLRLGSARR